MMKIRYPEGLRKDMQDIIVTSRKSTEIFKGDFARSLKDEITRKGTTEGDHREHLGASLIGHDCSRYLWYTFRWVKRMPISAQLGRIFKRGQDEEDRIILNLPYPVINRQQRVSAVYGHFGGSIDGMLDVDGALALIEFKTHNASSFSRLANHGLEDAKLQHYIQMLIYMRLLNLEYGIYLAVNKNDDDYYIQVVEAEDCIADDYLHRAEMVVESDILPNKVSFDATFYKCKMCHYINLCYYKEQPLSNCRTCDKSNPTDTGTWMCSQYLRDIPVTFQLKGCSAWKMKSCMMN